MILLFRPAHNNKFQFKKDLYGMLVPSGLFYILRLY